MAKAHAAVEKKYPDLLKFFEAKQEARRERAKEPFEKKLETLAKLKQTHQQLRSAKVVKTYGVKRG
jgi:hypothetical protein